MCCVKRLHRVTVSNMVREYIVKTASLFLLIGLICGLAGQVELIQPRVSFMRPSLWPHLLTLHIWATTISLVVICLSTFSLIRDRTTFGQWAIWLGLGILPFLLGVVINLMLTNVETSNRFLMDTVLVTSNRHAFGTAALMFALGGLSALQRVKFVGLSFKISFVFALLIAASGFILSLLQSRLGSYGLPRGYIEYPIEFAPLQFYSSVAAIACFILSVIYVIVLWQHSDDKIGVGEVF